MSDPCAALEAAGTLLDVEIDIGVVALQRARGVQPLRSDREAPGQDRSGRRSGTCRRRPADTGACTPRSGCARSGRRQHGRLQPVGPHIRSRGGRIRQNGGSLYILPALLNDGHDVHYSASDARNSS
jgi:hypothetical protein